MNKLQSMMACCIAGLTFFFSCYILAEEAYSEIEMKSDRLNQISEIFAKDEIEQMHKELLLWTDQAMINDLSKIAITDDYLKNLYHEYESIIVTPPNPTTNKEYGITNGEESLLKVTQLGHKIHNLGLAMSYEQFQRYGKLIQAMRDVLYIDAKHIPLAIRHDNSRDIYWYDFHNDLVKAAKDSYNELFGQ